MKKEDIQQQLLDDAMDLLEEMKGDQSLMEWIAIHHYREMENLTEQYNKLNIMKTANEIIDTIKQESEYSSDVLYEIDKWFDEEVETVYDEREGIDKDKKVVVWHFKDSGVYIRMTGWYSSYNGTEMDTSTLEEVKPVTKTIVDYVSKDKTLEKEEDMTGYGSYESY